MTAPILRATRRTSPIDWQPLPDVVGALHGVYADGSLVLRVPGGLAMVPRVTIGLLLVEG